MTCIYLHWCIRK